MEENSVLKFTCEKAIDGQLPFPDVLTMYTTENFTTNVYVKPTDNGNCLNGISECPDKYKETVILSYLKRAWTTCSSYPSFQSEIARVKQLLVNNAYTNRMIDSTIKAFMEKVNKHEPTKNDTEKTKVYYQNQMNSVYKVDEQVLKKIIKDNVKCKDDNNKLNIIIYYKNTKKSRNG